MASLVKLFNKNEQALRSELEGLQSPRNKEDLEKVINDIFNKHLNISTLMVIMPKQGADLLQSALQLVEASLDLVANSATQTESQAKESDAANNKRNSGFSHRLIEYLIKISTCKKQTNKPNIKNDYTINIDGLISGIRTICQRIDGIIDIYSRSIENKTTELENRPKPKLHSNYGHLIDSFSELFAAEVNEQDLKEPTTYLFRTLNNYGYEFRDYTESSQRDFEVEEVEEIATNKKQELINPAVLYGNECIVRGKVFILKSK